ncbi:hypothetical protein BpHYR1_046115 [Brachionus plicatilis]|uniref:Uncharacterized protein n=1 Tax=Brachionus plicatilis TaxID=10195 RepID=A0A3M7QM55_BRAPC|nr:hypothetical protein BpHYR1_046115 [Brachionus plicatilis]
MIRCLRQKDCINQNLLKLPNGSIQFAAFHFISIKYENDKCVHELIDIALLVKELKFKQKLFFTAIFKKQLCHGDKLNANFELNSSNLMF